MRLLRFQENSYRHLLKSETAHITLQRSRWTQPQTPAIDTDALADRIAQQIIAAQKPAPAPHDAWADFFGGKKL